MKLRCSECQRPVPPDAYKWHRRGRNFCSSACVELYEKRLDRLNGKKEPEGSTSIPLFDE